MYIVGQLCCIVVSVYYHDYVQMSFFVTIDFVLYLQCIMPQKDRLWHTQQHKQAVILIFMKL